MFVELFAFQIPFADPFLFAGWVSTCDSKVSIVVFTHDPVVLPGIDPENFILKCVGIEPFRPFLA